MKVLLVLRCMMMRVSIVSPVVFCLCLPDYSFTYCFLCSFYAAIMVEFNIPFALNPSLTRNINKVSLSVEKRGSTPIDRKKRYDNENLSFRFQNKHRHFHQNAIASRSHGLWIQCFALSCLTVVRIWSAQHRFGSLGVIYRTLWVRIAAGLRFSI